MPSSTPQSAGGVPPMGGNDIISDIDNNFKNEYKEQWSNTIISAMAKIQKLYAVESGLDEPLPPDFLTDEDKIKFFWSGFANTNKTKNWLDIIIKTVFHWEFFFILFVSTFLKIYAIKDMQNNINVFLFFTGYTTVLFYTIYLLAHSRYYLKGYLASRMIFLIMVGRLIYLLVAATLISTLILLTIGHFTTYPQELADWLLAISNIASIFSLDFDIKEAFHYMNDIVFPIITQSTHQMIIIFLFFGILPFMVTFFIKRKRDKKIKRQREEYEKG